MGVGALFAEDVDQDEKQSDRYVFQLWQGGMGLPERDYYIGKTDESKATLVKYREHVAKMLELLGDAPDAAKAGADIVVAIETKLAEASRTPVAASRPRGAIQQEDSWPSWPRSPPNVDWAGYFKTIDIAPFDYVIVGQPEFFQRVNEMLASVPHRRMARRICAGT